MVHQNYWENRDERKSHAAHWLLNIEENYKEYIQGSVDSTIAYKEDHVFNSIPKNNIPVMEVVVTDSVSATISIWDKYSPKRPCLLNFASYKNPGGKFLEGSKAQEECICHESTLYPVLRNFVGTYYEDNMNNKNNAMYLNRALYSPNIIFIRDGHVPVACNVLTCAAPNFTAASKYGRVTKEQNSKILKDRCKFVLDIMEENEVDLPILGAFGCGVIG